MWGNTFIDSGLRMQTSLGDSILYTTSTYTAKMLITYKKNYNFVLY